MNRTLRRTGIILTAALAIMLMLTVCSFADEEYYPTPQILGKNVLLKNADGTFYVDPDLPQGVQYDIDSSTLTLTDCTLAGDKDTHFCVSAGENTTIVLKGNNILKGTAENGCMGISVASDCSIKGDGKLTIDLSESTGRAVGIDSGTRLSIDGPTIDIKGRTTQGDYTLYGINVDPYDGYWMNTGEECYLEIKDAEINITNTCGDAYNVGIDTQDSDLKIENSNVQISLTGGDTMIGIASGQYWTDYNDSGAEGPVYGGAVSIDDKSRVTVSLVDIYNLEAYKKLSMYCFKDNISSNYMYIGDKGTAAVKSDKSAMYKNINEDDGTVRYECRHDFLEFAPEETTHDDPVIPEDQGQPDDQQGGDSDGEGQQGDGSGDTTPQPAPSDGSGDTTPQPTPSDGSGDGNAADPDVRAKSYNKAYRLPYNGKDRSDNIVVKDTKTEQILVKGVDYTIKCDTDMKSIGKHAYTIRYIGKYAGNDPSGDAFLILPARGAVKSLKGGKKRVTVTAKKLKGGVKYEVAYSIKGKGQKIKTFRKNKFVLKKLKSKKVYRIKVRAYKVVQGVKYAGKWSRLTKAKVK